MKDQKEVEEYLASIRQTIAKSENLIAEAQLRIAETDRFLEAQGLTREQVLSLKLSGEQRRLVDEELKRRGLPGLHAARHGHGGLRPRAGDRRRPPHGGV